jgi:hypothetical protein
MMRKRRNTGLGVLAILGALATAAPTAASADCFDRSRPRLPTFDSVQAHLTNGASGQDVYRAVADGDAARVEVLIAADPSLLSTRTELPEGVRPSNGNSADLLTAAVARCDLAMVETLLRLGADPDGAIPGLPLTYAILADELGLATVLLEGGAAPDAHDAGLSTPLHEALMFERAEAVTLLASYGADVNRPDARGGIPLGTALSGQNWPEALALIEAGANPWQVHLEGILPAYMILISEPASGRIGASGRRCWNASRRARRSGRRWIPQLSGRGSSTAAGRRRRCARRASSSVTRRCAGCGPSRTDAGRFRIRRGTRDTLCRPMFLPFFDALRQARIP